VLGHTRLVADFSQQRPGFTPRAVHEDLWWTKWNWVRLFSKSFGFSRQHHSTSAPQSLMYHMVGWTMVPLAAAAPHRHTQSIYTECNIHAGHVQFTYLAVRSQYEVARHSFGWLVIGTRPEVPKLWGTLGPLWGRKFL
jgi:hypothetical protein